MVSTQSVTLPSVASDQVPVFRYLGIIMAIGIGTFSFNSASVTVAYILQDLGGTDAEAALVLAGYAIPFAGMLILGGRLGDKFGRKKLFTIGIGAFLVATLASMLAPSFIVLIIARVVQGLCSGLFAPQVLATVQATSTGQARIRAIAAFGASGGIGAALGQVLGGALGSLNIGDFHGWRLPFGFVIIVGVASLILSRMAPHSHSHDRVDIDVIGTLLLGCGIVLISAGLAFGPSSFWSWPTVAALVIGLALLWLMWRQQSRIENSGRVALLPPSLLRQPALILGLVAAVFYFGGYAALSFNVPRSLIGGLGLNSLEAGLTMMPFAVAFTIVSLCMARIQRWLGSATLIWGLFILIFALVCFSFTVWFFWSQSLVWFIQPSLVLFGIGQGMAYSPLTQAIVRMIPPKSAGLSGGLFSVAQQIALSLGVITISGIITSTGWHGKDELVAGTVLNLGCGVVVLVLALILTRLAAKLTKSGTNRGE